MRDRGPGPRTVGGVTDFWKKIIWSGTWEDGFGAEALGSVEVFGFRRFGVHAGLT